VIEKAREIFRLPVIQRQIRLHTFVIGKNDDRDRRRRDGLRTSQRRIRRAKLLKLRRHAEDALRFAATEHIEMRCARRKPRALRKRSFFGRCSNGRKNPHEREPNPKSFHEWKNFKPPRLCCQGDKVGTDNTVLIYSI